MCLWSVQEVLYYLADGRGTHRLHGRYRGSLVFKRNYIRKKTNKICLSHSNTHSYTVDHLLYDMREHWRHMSMSMSMSTMCPPSPRSIPYVQRCASICYYNLYDCVKMCPSPFLSLLIISRAQEVRVPLFCEVCICILREEETCFVYTCSVRCLLHAPARRSPKSGEVCRAFRKKLYRTFPGGF